MKNKVEIIHVSVKVRAIEVGHYNGDIVPVGKEFTYNGGLNRKGTLPLWVEALDEDEAEKIIAKAKADAAKKKEKKEVAPAAPALPAMAPAADSAPAKKVASVKPAAGKGGKGAKSLADSVA